MATTTTGTAAGDAPGHGGTALVGDHSHGAGTPQRSRAERVRSFDVADFPIPGGREEDWRFTPMDRLHDLHDGAQPSAARPRWTSTRPRAHGSRRSAGTTTGWAGRRPRGPRGGRRLVGFSRRRGDRARRGGLERPSTISVPGRGGTTFAHVTVIAERGSSGDRRARPHGSGPSRQRRAGRRRRRAVAPGLHPGLGRRRRAPVRRSAPGSAGTPRLKHVVVTWAATSSG
jgi:hypothetical protein